MTPTPKGEKSDAREYAKFYVGDCDHLPRGACKRCVERAIKDAFRDGENSMRERAEEVVVEYRANGPYETGHGFMMALDAIAGRILFLPSVQKEEGRE